MFFSCKHVYDVQIVPSYAMHVFKVHIKKVFVIKNSRVSFKTRREK